MRSNRWNTLLIRRHFKNLSDLHYGACLIIAIKKLQFKSTYILCIGYDFPLYSITAKVSGWKNKSSISFDFIFS